MKSFINDENAIGKWQKVAVVKNKKEYFKGNAKDSNVFPFDTLYLMEKGQEYWVISWTKGYINIKGVQNPYEIENDLMFVGIVDRKNGKIDDYAVYKKIDSKRYTPEEIVIKDNIDVQFIKDKKVIGFWESCDFVRDIKSFNPNKKFWNDPLFLSKLAFSPNGEVISTYKNGNSLIYSWTKNYVISKQMSTKSKYQIETINEVEYLFMEWKSGDYTYGGKVPSYYVFKKI